MAKLFEQWKALPPLTHVNRLGHAMMFQATIHGKAFRTIKPEPPLTTMTLLAYVMMLQSVIYGQAFRTIENGTAPYNPEPPGLCDGASGNYLRQRILNK
jgi:hypothetical protein